MLCLPKIKWKVVFAGEKGEKTCLLDFNYLKKDMIINFSLKELGGENVTPEKKRRVKMNKT